MKKISIEDIKKIRKYWYEEGNTNIPDKNYVIDKAFGIIKNKTQDPHSTAETIVDEMNYGKSDEQIFKKFSKSKKIKSHIDLIDKNKDMSKGANKEDIQSNYPTNDPKIVFEAWTDEQRVHFLYDHKLPVKFASINYDELPDEVKTQIIGHIETGRYENGAKIENEKNYEKKIKSIVKDLSFIKNVSIEDFGVEINTISGDKILLTKGELLSMAMASFEKEKSIVTINEMINWLNVIE